MKKKIFIITGGIAVIIISFIFFQNQNKSIETMGYEIKNTTYRDVISSIGNVEYESQIVVKTKVSGTIIEFNNEVGDKVNVGNLIAKIDNSEAQITYNEILNKSVLAKAKYEDYMNSYGKNVESIKDQRVLQEKEIEFLKLEQSQLNAKILETRGLLTEDIIPAKDLETLNEQMDLLELKLETATAKLNALRTPALAVQEIKSSIEAANESVNKQNIELKKYSIESPIDGIVVDKKVEAGTFVQYGEVILEIASDKEKYAVLEIDEKYISKVSIGDEANIFIEAYPDETVKGVVVKTNPEVNKDSGTIGLKVKILEKKELFLRNMSVKVEFVSETFDNTIVIPGKYLVGGKESSVFIEDKNGLAVKKEIVIYNKNDNNVMVLEGLKEGEIILNPENLVEGKRVKVNLSLERESKL